MTWQRSRILLSVLSVFCLAPALHAEHLPGTKPLKLNGDLAKLMVEGIGKYLDRETAASVEKRTQEWNLNRSSLEAFQKSVEPNRQRFARLIGAVDKRLPATMEHVSTTEQPALIAQTDKYKVYTVRWTVLPGVYGEGLLFEPNGPSTSKVVALPDADWTPEMIAGLAPGLPAEAQFARRLAEKGARVVVVTLIDRKDTYSNNLKVNRWTNQPHREFVYRMSYEMGRHIIGYEVQKVLAAIEWLTYPFKENMPVTLVGYGEGGLVALYSAALDGRVENVLLSGYFGPREGLADEPIYRNVWGLNREFGDAGVGTLVRGNIICEHANWPQIKGPPPVSPGTGAAPGALATLPFSKVDMEFGRMLKADYYTLAKAKPPTNWRTLVESKQGLAFSAPYFSRQWGEPGQPPKDTRPKFDPAPRQKRQFDQLVDFTQKLMPDAVRQRQNFFWSRANYGSADAYEKSTQPMREHFQDEIIGKLPAPTMPMNPRTRLLYDTPKWKGYEVVLDLYEDVICYGILLVPNDIKPGEKRPVVVCQHGLEGRPTDVCNPAKKTTYYNSFGAQLADKGFVVFAPQNPYIFGNQFRQLVRKGHPLKISLYSFIVAQHERILDWLTTLPYVDANRIAFYGLSYGGKVAMRIGALVTRYCLVICSGDFNEWIWKNITLDWANSYMFTGEYDMYEFNLGQTFNYAEMAGLIAPRPFMVERGHNDGVGLDEYVAFEYAKVRRLYARLGLPERTAIEFFQGGHEIHLQGTLAFLQRHLKWPGK